MLNRNTPFIIVARLNFTRYPRILGIPSLLVPLIQGLLPILNKLILGVSFIPTIVMLISLKKVFFSEQSLDSLNKYGTNIEKEFVEYLKQNWALIINNKRGIIRFRNSFLFSLILYTLKPITAFILRILFTLIISTLGIFYSETLSSIKFLYSYALTIRDWLKPYIEIKIPNENKYIKYTALFCIGFISLGLSFIGIDLTHLDWLAHIPYSNNILSAFYYVFTPVAMFYSYIRRFLP